MFPKQLLPLVGAVTMLQATAMRARGLPAVADECLIVSNENHRFSVAEQMNALDMSAKIVLEPEGRNTAPAVALAALQSLEVDEDSILLVMAADHVIKNLSAFENAVMSGLAAAEIGQLVTFGVVPTHPETGYGYVKATPNGKSYVPVEAFVEKPDLATARAYLDAGSYFWNSGMFLFRADVILEELGRHAPDILKACRDSMQNKTLDGDFVRPSHQIFNSCPADSLDCAVMEKSTICSMVPLDAGWSDVGSWSALHDVCERDGDGNFLNGDAWVHNCTNTLIQAESRLVTAIGLENMVVVETKDAVLVADKKQSQEVKILVDRLKESQREETSLHRQVFRPWGSFDSLENAENFQVKRLVVKPGAELSLQKHAHRSEHWVVVKGKARVTRNDEVFDLNTNESTYISIGDIHRIANPFDEPAHIIEVQCGDYLGEDDIVRLEDNYGREGTKS
tara:strand:- start:9996 stop:11351 length:1356 start_codon:yes stop_codon:yes gene_type:complete